MKTQRIGNAAEDTALKFLQGSNLHLIERNFSCKMGEIDLIMKDSKTLIFVEVRLRSNPNHGSGAESVTYRKQQRIINTAKFYLLKYPLQGKLDCRFDVISIDTKIDWIQDAFTLS